MEEQKRHMLELLKGNKGFLQPEIWIDYAISHCFKQVHADKFEACPDCGARKTAIAGQYVYYSTLVNLLSCNGCGLYFTDTRIDPKVIQSHFEHAYKDETYFMQRRRRIFDQILNEVDRCAPRGGSVLDVGGAKGHLLAMLSQRRPDLHLVLNDLSKDACEYAARKYNFETICGGIGTLEQTSRRFDVVIMSDVIYLEPDLKTLWNVLPRLTTPSGAVVLRVPNKLPLIRLWQALKRVLAPEQELKMQDHIKFFNPEHLFVFSRGYLSRRLKQIGYQTVRTMPSELLIPENSDSRHVLYFHLSHLISLLTNRSLIITPSMLMVAKKG